MGVEALKFGAPIRVFFQAIGYYRAFAAGSPKKPVQAHKFFPFMPPKPQLTASKLQLFRICYVQLVPPLFFYRLGH